MSRCMGAGESGLEVGAEVESGLEVGPESTLVEPFKVATREPDASEPSTSVQLSSVVSGLDLSLPPPVDVVAELPTESPTELSSELPTELLSKSPSESPSELPTESPSKSPSKSPSELPTESPSKSPSKLSNITPPSNPQQTQKYSPTETAIICKNISKSFETVFAVKNLTFSVPKGKILAFLGPNGAGKSTTLNMIMGLTPVSQGEILISGKYSVPQDLNKIYRNLGVCPQHDIFWPELTVLQQMSFFARLKGIPESTVETTVVDILHKIQLYDKKNAFLKQLSGGMRRKVSIGQAFLGNPAIVLLDEPTTGLDIVAREVVSSFILSQKGCTIILNTHDLREAEELADSIIILKDGELKAVGTSQELKAQFSQGYLVEIDVDSKPQAQAYISSNFQGAQIIEEYEKRLLYRLQAHLTLSFIFEKMSQAKSHSISDWGVQHADLEQAFLKIVE